MSDFYHHHHLTITGEQEDNLVALGRWLVLNRDAIAAVGGMYFGNVDPWIPAPDASLPLEGRGRGGGRGGGSPVLPQLPALSYGPHAGIAPLLGETWPAYRLRAFGVADGSPLLHWLQAAEWEKTEPSPVGTALRIAYLLDFGVPVDYLAISRGEAHADYDTSGFLWDRLDLLPTNLTPDGKDFVPLRQWPPWRPAGSR